MSVLYIARHGNTFSKGDVVRRIGARTDLPLSPSGIKQAEALAAEFAPRIEFSAILAAPLKRTSETARIIANRQSGAPQIEPVPALTEIDYGPDEGAPEADVIARIGQDAIDRWDREAVSPPGWRVDAAAQIDGWKRIFSRCRASEGANMLTVTSNGVARFALFAADETQNKSLKLRTGAYGVLKMDSDGAVRVEGWDLRP